ncbi:trehalose-phosphatase [candidate division KSB1 bacterium]|nr:trehalose-phosphatase [candidate division KSB1 bacterium]
MVAEHGVWFRHKNTNWEMIEPLDAAWKTEISPILELYVDRTPGSFIEEKEYSLVWHYRKSDPGQGEIRARELVNHLVYMTSNLNLQVLEGSKVVEVKNSGVNKGHAAAKWIIKENWEFILAIGDDWTDEDIFKSLPEKAYSIKVGFVSTEAKYKIKSPVEVRQLLKELSEVEKV